MVAPMTGEICGVDWSCSSFSFNNSARFVFADEGCLNVLGSTEEYQATGNLNCYTRQFRFPPVPVTQGESYDFYLTAGSLSGTTTGIWVSAIDVSEDSGNLIQTFGIAKGSLMGLTVHEPPTEGGAGVPTVSNDFVHPAVPVYSSISSGGGGSSGTVASFAAA